MALKQGNGTQTGWCCKATLQQVHSCPIPCLVPMSHQGCSMSHRVHLFSCPLCRDRNLLSLQRGALFGCVSCPSPSPGGVGLRPARWGCAGGRRFICPPLFAPHCPGAIDLDTIKHVATGHPNRAPKQWNPMVHFECTMNGPL